MRGEADLVVGDREVQTIEHFSPREEAAPAARQLGRAARLGHDRARHDLGLSRLQPRGRASGAGRLALHLHARDDHPGRQDAGRDRPRPDPDEPEDARVAPVQVDLVVRAHERARRSSAIYTQYEPLRVFLDRGRARGAGGRCRLGPLLRPLRPGRRRQGHVQSVVLGAMLFVVAVQLAALGIIGDLLAANRVLIQRTLERTRRIELKLGVEPSHYEPGERRAPGAADATETITARQRAGGPARRPRSTRPCRSGAAGEPGGRTPAPRRASRPATPTTSTARPTRSCKRLMAGFERDMFELLDRAAPGFDPRRRAAARACSPSSGRTARRAAWSASTSRTRSCARSGSAARRPNLEFHAGDGHTLPYRGRRVRGRDRDGGARARARPGRGARRDGARGVALAARERSARAAVARPQHGARRLPARSRQHARPPEPLVQAQLRRAARPLRGDRRAALAASRGRWPSSASGA